MKHRENGKNNEAQWLHMYVMHLNNVNVKMQLLPLCKWYHAAGYALRLSDIGLKHILVINFDYVYHCHALFPSFKL